MNFFQFLESKTKQDYRVMARAWVDRANAYIQANAQRSLVVGFAIGIVLVLFLRFVLTLVLIAGLIALVMYIMAPESPTDRTS